MVAPNYAAQRSALAKKIGSGRHTVITSPEAAVPARLTCSPHAGAVSASGAVDHVVGRLDGETVLVKIGGGSALLPRVTATGCALGALSAAYASVAPDPLTGLVSAHVHFAVASELAETVASKPGGFSRRARHG